MRFAQTASLLIAALLASTSLTNSATAANYALDASHTSIVFSVNHLGFSYTYGMFRKSQGKFSFDRANPAASNFQISIDAASLDTMEAKRDEHLRSPDFFNVNQFPTITFVSKSVAKRVGRDGKEFYDVTGTMTMHGVSRDLTLPMQYIGEGQGPYGKYRVGFLCQTTLKRSEFGMNTMQGGIGDNIGITVSFEGLRQEGAAAAGSATR